MLQFTSELIVGADCISILDILLKVILRLSDLSQSMTDLVDNVATDDNTKNLNEQDDDYFNVIDWKDVSIANCKHGSSTEVDAVDVSGHPVFWLLSYAFHPVERRVQEGHRVQDYCLNNA